jgi:FAD:protein FMN transferase
MITSVLEKDRGCADHEEHTATRSMRAIGTSVVVAVTDADRADEAMALLAKDLWNLDATCSRFRVDSELRQIEQASAGRPVAVSPLLFEALEVADSVAVRTAGIVDPTVGSALVQLGYDRDFDEIAGGCIATDLPARPAPGWWQIELDPETRTVAIPVGIHLDLGATAKALAADRAAHGIALALDCGVLVNLGGDVAVAGRGPEGGWAIGIAPHCTTPLDSVDQVVAITGGGLATSGTTARSWARSGRTVHHIVDPWTGESAPPVWSLVSITAPSCVDANGWSTAAVVWGEDAPGNLTAVGAPARLVGADGRVVLLGGWPDDVADRGGDIHGTDRNTSWTGP